jgi:protein O-GlcNAc transferase
MPLSLVDEEFNRATDAHRRGLLTEARRIYQSIVTSHPDHAGACSNLAAILASEGRLEQAERLFRQAITNCPSDAKGHNNLGLLLQDRNRSEEAIAAYQEAVRLNPDYAAAIFNLGNVFRHTGDLQSAETAYRRALELKPEFAEARCNLALLLHAIGKSDLAVAELHRTIQFAPDYMPARFNLGVLMHSQNRLEEAAAAYHEITTRKPDPIAYSNLGVVLHQQGKLTDALDAFRQAVTLSPIDPHAWFNLGMVLQEQGELDAALVAYERALESKSDYADACVNIALIFQLQGRLTDAITMQRRAVELDPISAQAHSNFGALLLEQGRPEDAIRSIQHAILLKPDYPDAFYNLGNAQKELGNLQEAIAAYERAVELAPNHPEACAQLFYHRLCACDWSHFDEAERSLRHLVRGGFRIPPFILLGARSTTEEIGQCARVWCAQWKASRSEAENTGRRGQVRRRRIGYLSGDFHQHATASLAVELFETHDRSRFEICAYSYGPNDGSAMRNRLTQAFDTFVDIRTLPHRDAAKRISQDGVDILVDLKGHTHGSRPQILAMRPAPVQVNFLGFPGTMGADFIDYIIADRVVVPQVHQGHYTEKVVYIDRCYQVNSRRDIAVRSPSRHELGLPDKAFVYCCFNNSFKITPVFFKLWMRLLSSVPHAVLWLLESNELATQNLIASAISCAVDPQRIVFARRVSEPEHLARLSAADLFLDTLPCNGHTTASDAIWADVPILTMLGETFAGRVAGSLLRALELDELITGLLPDYERLAIELAHDRTRLDAIRATLRRNREERLNIGSFTTELEAAYIRMLQLHDSGFGPKSC